MAPVPLNISPAFRPWRQAGITHLLLDDEVRERLLARPEPEPSEAAPPVQPVRQHSAPPQREERRQKKLQSAQHAVRDRRDVRQAYGSLELALEFIPARVGPRRRHVPLRTSGRVLPEAACPLLSGRGSGRGVFVRFQRTVGNIPRFKLLVVFPVHI